MPDFHEFGSWTQSGPCVYTAGTVPTKTSPSFFNHGIALSSFLYRKDQTPTLQSPRDSFSKGQMGVTTGHWGLCLFIWFEFPSSRQAGPSQLRCPGQNWLFSLQLAVPALALELGGFLPLWSGMAEHSLPHWLFFLALSVLCVCVVCHTHTRDRAGLTVREHFSGVSSLPPHDFWGLTSGRPACSFLCRQAPISWAHHDTLICTVPWLLTRLCELCPFPRN